MEGRAMIMNNQHERKGKERIVNNHKKRDGERVPYLRIHESEWTWAGIIFLFLAYIDYQTISRDPNCLSE